MADPEFEKQQLEVYREYLRTAPNFICTCCGRMKPKGEVAGASIWRQEAGDPTLHPRKVGIYGLCLECVELPEAEIHRKVTVRFGKEGLFDPVK